MKKGRGRVGIRGASPSSSFARIDAQQPTVIRLGHSPLIDEANSFKCDGLTQAGIEFEQDRAEH